MPFLSPLDGVMYYKDCPSHARATLQQLSQYQESVPGGPSNHSFRELFYPNWGKPCRDICALGETHTHSWEVDPYPGGLTQSSPSFSWGEGIFLSHCPQDLLNALVAARPGSRANLERQIERILLQCPQFLRFYFSAKLAFLCSLKTPFKQFLVLYS